MRLSIGLDCHWMGDSWSMKNLHQSFRSREYPIAKGGQSNGFALSSSSSEAPVDFR